MEKHTIGLATEVLIMAIVISVILLFLGIGVLVLIHVCIVGRTLRASDADADVRERNTMQMVERGSLGSRSMSQDDIEKLPCFDFAAKASPAGDCAVCLDAFKAGDRCRLLPSCNHTFHADCVDLWLLRTPICPICRAVAAHHLDLGLGEREEAAAAAAADERDQSFQVVGILDNPATDSQTREGMSSSERVIEFELRERLARI